MDNVDYYTLDIYFRKTDWKRFIRETNLNKLELGELTLIRLP